MYDNTMVDSGSLFGQCFMYFHKIGHMLTEHEVESLPSFCAMVDLKDEAGDQGIKKILIKFIKRNLHDLVVKG